MEGNGGIGIVVRGGGNGVKTMKEGEGGFKRWIGWSEMGVMDDRRGLRGNGGVS